MDSEKRKRAVFDLSQQAADNLFGISNLVLILGAALVLTGTIGAVWTSGVRERYANERISRNEAITAEAQAAAAKANEETAKALLEQERIKAQIAFRRLSAEQHGKIVTALAGIKGEVAISAPWGDAEALLFASDLDKTLRDAGLTTKGVTQAVRNEPAFGLFLGGPKGSPVDSIGNALVGAGLTPGVVTDAGQQIVLIVGSKPPAF